MDIKFFDDPFEGPKPREEVRIKQLGLYMHADGRRVAVGFDITPFMERPSLQVTFINERGEEAGSLHVIETLQTNFSLTVHLRDKAPTDTYEVTAVVYYATPETERVDVHTISRTLDRTTPGEQ
ncbi:MAG: hypothetical protein DHS20C20_04490 [Ardenticatenaceae bacterium]|nr:MAG: hypothetical protein DHS20C20_04490 [Ardenticatenaceae bacterium]